MLFCSNFKCFNCPYGITFLLSHTDRNDLQHNGAFFLVLDVRKRFLFKWTKTTLEVGHALGNVAKNWAITETSSLSESTNLLGHGVDNVFFIEVDGSYSGQVLVASKVML